MKLLFDFFPILLFFIAFKLFGIYVATAVAIAASVLQVGYVYLKNKRVENMHLITLALIIILGGATLIFHDETFIKWKPTIVNWGFALVFLGSHFIGKKPIVRHLMDQALYLPEKVWNRLSYMWVVFFIFSGIANLYVAFNYDTDTWVNFKLFGLMGLTLAFILVQGVYISRYIQDDNLANEVNEKAMETLADVEMDSVVVAKHQQEGKDDERQPPTSPDTK
ncbi:MAG: septation protein A [Thiotrichales bacterium]|nr:septation protein A [Thiotrichales bacterium]